MSEIKPEHMEALEEAIKYAHDELDISFVIDLIELRDVLATRHIEGAGE